MTEYTGTEGVLEIAGSPIALAEFSLRVTRGVASHGRSGKHSDLKLPGKVDVTGSIKRIMIDGSLLGKVIGDTEETGTAHELKTAIAAPGAGAEAVVDMTDTNSDTSLIKLTAVTAAITAVGKMILYGTDINSEEQTEVITVTKLGIGETITGKKIFKTLTHVVTFDYVSATGTITIDSVAGASGISVGEAKIFKIEGKATSGGNHVYITADNCFLTDGEFAFTDADTIMSDTLSFTMKDPDADLKVEYV